MKYEVHYGQFINNLSIWECEAESEAQAKKLFRNKFGFNYIKIQRVILVK